ncbi:hypothetical protein BJ742DRAFT_821693 [Cladochytrium replicatum]|nr:hypothetical protein BJ742DRAFT_821693 [Cladochytrium replicatum]
MANTLKKRRVLWLVLLGMLVWVIRPQDILVQSDADQVERNVPSLKHGPKPEQHGEHDLLGATPRKQPDFSIDDFAVAVKTGGDVSAGRIPIQLATFLSGVKNRLFIGDSPGLFVGNERVHDVISGLYEERMGFIPPEIIAAQNSKKGDNQKDLSVNESKKRESAPGWKMDAHKNLPGFKLLHRTYPNASWYMMIDDDTYVLWNNLMRLLKDISPEEPVYMGTPAHFVGCDGVRVKGDGPAFAHGGSGILISRGALSQMIKGLSLLEAAVAVDQLPDGEELSVKLGGIDKCIVRYRTCWAGDVRTALCLRDHGILLNRTHSFNAEPPFSPTHKWPKNPCQRPATFHHLEAIHMQILTNMERTTGKHPDTMVIDMAETRSHAATTSGITYAELFQRYWNDHLSKELSNSFAFEVNVDRPGRDYKAYEVSTILHTFPMLKSTELAKDEHTSLEDSTSTAARICMRLCESAFEPACSSWSYEVASNNCWLKSGVTVVGTPKEQYFSGAVPTKYICSPKLDEGGVYDSLTRIVAARG